MRISPDTLWVLLLGYVIHTVSGAAFLSQATQIRRKNHLFSLNKMLVIGEHDCPPHSQPWQAALFQKQDFKCGGVLIHPQWVLSAGHCGTGIELVGLGLHSIFPRRDPGSQLIRPIMAVQHPDYRPSTPHVHDLMLIKLSKPALISDTVKTIRMATKCPYIGTSCTVSGWGGPWEETTSLYLQCMQANVVFPELCRKADSTKVFNKMNKMICTSHGANQSTSWGDSGGPLVCNGELQGIISGWAVGSIYSRNLHISICKYQKWIEETLKNF